MLGRTKLLRQPLVVLVPKAVCADVRGVGAMDDCSLPAHGSAHSVPPVAAARREQRPDRQAVAHATVPSKKIFQPPALTASSSVCLPYACFTKLNMADARLSIAPKLHKAGYRLTQGCVRGVARARRRAAQRGGRGRLVFGHAAVSTQTGCTSNSCMPVLRLCHDVSCGQ